MDNYLIEKGDTLSSIAEKYGVSLKDVIGNNPWIANSNQITAGDYLYMPNAQRGVEVFPGNYRFADKPLLPTTEFSIPGMRYVTPPYAPSNGLRLEASPRPTEVVDNPVVAPAVAPVVAPVDTAPPPTYIMPDEIVVEAPRWREPYSRDLSVANFGPSFNLGPEVNIPAPAIAQQQPGMDLLAMYQKYAPKTEDYSGELRAAQAETATHQKAFNDSIQRLINEKVEGPSKAELYFRLAAAFSEPTKTGHFIESLGKAGGVAADYNKEQRVIKQAQRSEALKLGLEKQKLDLQSAKDRETNLRALASEDNKSRREMAKEIIKDYVTSGRPQSSAGKQALDEGLTPGTPEYQSRVAEIGNLLVERQMAAINASLAGVQAQRGQLALGERKEARAQRAEGKLTSQELDLKVDTEDAISTASGALDSLQQALKLNPKTFDTSIGDLAQRKALEAVGSADPRVINTRNMENLLKQQALSQLKSLVGGNPTEGERAVIMDLQGVDAKSTAERQLIIERAIKTIENRKRKSEERLKNINAGRYRQTTGEQ